MTRNDMITLGEVPEVLGCLPEFLPSTKSIDFITPDYLGSFAFHKGAAAADALHRISLRHALVDLELISDAKLTFLEREVASGSIPARKTLERVKSLAIEKITRYVSDIIQLEMFDRLSNKLKARGFTDNSPVHPALVDAIDICSRNGHSNLDLLESVLKNEILHCPDLIAAIVNGSQSVFHNTAIRSLDQAPLEFIKEHTEGFYTPEKEAEALKRWQESLKDEITLTPLKPDTCYADPVSNRAVLIKAQPFDGKLDGMYRFRDDFSEDKFIPIYTWHDSYPSPHECSYRTPVDFLVDTLGKKLPSSWVKDVTESSSFNSWQMTGRNFSPIEEAFEEKGLYIAPIEIREGYACPYHVGYTWANGFIADGFAITPKELIGKSSSYGREIWLEMLEQEISILNGYYCGDGFEAKVYNLQTKELIEKDHAVRYAECFKNIKIPIGATVLRSCPDLETTLELMKHSLRTEPQKQRSLLSLAQEARSASEVLSKGAVKQVERNLESR